MESISSKAFSVSTTSVEFGKKRRSHRSTTNVSSSRGDRYTSNLDRHHRSSHSKTHRSSNHHSSTHTSKRELAGHGLFAGFIGFLLCFGHSRH